MYLQHEVVWPSEDRLSERRWHFRDIEGKVVLDFYGEFSRPTTRHKMVLGKAYHRLNSRDNCTIAVPPLPGTVLEEALRMIRSQIHFDGTIPVQY